MKAPQDLSVEDVRKLVQELQIHQSELELQNEELLKTQAELEESRRRYIDLYDFSPVGYLILDAAGVIRELNLTAASQLGKERNRLIGELFSYSVAAEDHDKYNLHLSEALRSHTAKTCEIKLAPSEGPVRWVQLNSLSVGDFTVNPLCRVSVADISELKYTENALSEAQRRFELLLSSGPAVIYSSKATGDYGTNFVSENVVSLFGYEAREFIASSGFWLDHIHPEDAPRILAELSRLFEEGRQTLEYRFLHKDEEYRWVHDEVKLIGDAAGNSPKIVGYWTDVTERKMAEENLHDSEVRYRQLFSTVLDAIVVFDAETMVFLDANDAALRLYGYSKEEFLQLRLSDIFAEPEELAESTEQTLSYGALRIPLCYHKRNGGALFPVEISAVVFESKDRKIIWGVMRDITERKMADDALRESEERYRQTADNIRDVLWMADLELSKMIYVNPAYEEIWGRTCASLYANPESWLEAIHSEDRERTDAARKQGATGGYAVEYRIVRPDGSVRWIWDRGFPILNQSGEIYRMAGIAEDVTEEKRLRQEAEHHLQQIIQADKLSSLGQMVAGVVHEINNPNSFITYNVPLLEESWKLIEPVLEDHALCDPEWKSGDLSLEELCQDMRGIIEDIKTGSDRINKVVKNLKDFARLDESVHTRPVQVNEIITRTMSIVDVQIRKRVGKVALNLAEHLPDIEGHFHKLEQVVANLVLNAAHSTEEREQGRISIATRYIKRLNSVLIEVEDNGKGIERDMLDRIFEPFFTTRRTCGGTGLGLSVSYGLVQEHRGIIGVLSRPGLGSRFTVYLPVERGKDLDLHPTILCIDDNVSFLSMLKVQFGRVNKPFSSLHDSESVLVYLDEHPEIDLIMSDLMMPNMDGWELLQKVKERFPLLPFILYSGNTWALKKRPEHVPKPDFLLEKPFEMQRLIEIINSISRQRL